MEVDKRHVLDDEIFSYRVGKDTVIFLYWHGKLIKTIKGQEAQKFLAKIEQLDEKGKQLVMAKLTGNFKHGNERRL